MIIEAKTKLELLDCIECGAYIALTENQHRMLRQTHRNFYCSNGHPQVFLAESEAEKLRKALHAAELEKTRLAQQAKDAREASDRAALKLAVVEREAARVKKRTAAGVCPCCNRTFSQLARHMKAKHPNAADK